MPVFLDDNRLDDRQRLLAAVDYLQEIVELSFASEHIKMPLLLFLRTAWSDILERNELDRVRARIREVPDPWAGFTDVEQAVPAKQKRKRRRGA